MANGVTYELRDGVAQVVLDDGKLNVMSTTMLDKIAAAFDRAEKEAEIAVLRSARPGIFSAGFDLKLFAAGDAARSLDMVRAGAELALRLLSFPHPTIGVMEGHAFPMGTFLLLACDVRLGARGPHRMGLNEVAIGIAPPSFAIELARSRLHPAWLSRTAVLGEMYEPDEALTAGFLDRVVAPQAIDGELEATIAALRAIHKPSHATAKQRLRQPAMDAMRNAIDRELTMAAYEASNRARTAVAMPGQATPLLAENARPIWRSFTEPC
ncbi:crotonase/enoyl-CoA hydratase family protein [Bradyrhizobium sp. GCM10027634]|uniref:crotonase/enoyl-CoA hydratase family protein n=1 Tax=unclassified Bradyrhizobium TaxID=2631580 RepID=UPI00188D0F4D|nr:MULTISPECIES: crotonase/enoyl-CoA hydratase family protein [unclassified Bradyrhizobium]MDN4999745.1 crotonase/enoyl-CoA hydratase family protein [Bradyrhizobium sp. WYCCWR 12677]QOZ43352.1 crotonase/enoyl-CoA hydratase family protein [Bradyrhizobium sp. CCBAU 53340]